MNYPQLESERLLLRKLELSDADDIVEGLNNRDISKWLIRVPCPFTEEDVQEYINENGERFRSKDDDKYFHWGIVLKSENKVIGAVRFWEIGGYAFAPKPSATSEIWINEKYKGHEFGLEAKCLFTDYALRTIGTQSMISQYRGENIASHKMNKRAGFQVFDAEGGNVLAYMTKRNWQDGKRCNPHYDRIKKYIPQPKIQERRR